MKKSLLICLATISLSAHAQIDIGIPGKTSINEEDAAKIRVATKNAEYNGAIVGYAQSCNFSPTDYQKIEYLLFKNFNAIGLTHSEIDRMRSVYEESIRLAKIRGKNHSPTECSLFGNEFKKIVNTIKTS